MFDTVSAVNALHRVTAALKALGIPHFLIQGTALGAHRHGDFVPDEKDIDIGVLQEHLTPHAGRLCQAFVDSGCEIETWARPFNHVRTIVAYLNSPCRIKVDIVGFNKWHNKRFTACPVHPSIPNPYAIVHDAALLETCETAELCGLTFNVPSPVTQYLELEYGPDWRTPKDDHVSRTRIYNFLQDNGITDDTLTH